MNNEQNNSIFGIPNQNATPSNQAPEQNAVPGANLSPVSSNEPTTATAPASPAIETPTTTEVAPTIPVQPIPGMPANNDPTALASNQAVPGIVTASSTNNVTEQAPTPELKVESNNPFDIGIGQSNDTEKTQIITPITPVDNSISSGVDNTNNGNDMNSINNLNTPNNQPINNNLGNATPLSSESSNNVSNDNNTVVSVGKYLLHMFLFAIPLVGFIMLLVKAFSKKENKNISNYAKAQLLLSLIAVVLSVVIMIVFGATFASIAANSTTEQTNNYDGSSNYQNDNYDYNY